MPAFARRAGGSTGVVQTVRPKSTVRPTRITLRPDSPVLYGPCDLDEDEIERCIQDTGRAIVAASWLTATARRELSSFKEFMKWLRYGKPYISPVHRRGYTDFTAPEIMVAGAPDDAPYVAPTHDILEVNDYLLSGLHHSQIDRWFSGDAPTFLPQDLGVPDEKPNLATAMQRARLALADRSSTDLYHVGMCSFRRSL